MENKILAFLSELGVTLGLKLLSALLVLVIGLKLTKILVKLVKKSRTFSKLDHSIQSFIDSFLSIGLNVLIFLTVAYVLGIPMTSFITILASAGVAIGLALQGSLSNFAGGLMILFFKPFKIGDFIEIAAINGTVKAITVFYTVLLTADNKQITLPNGNLSNASIVNYSTEPKRRVDLTFSVSSHCDLEQVKQILLQT
ncbi:MAG: mechanosensitive ion channel, partial [Clostridiales bacterium]